MLGLIPNILCEPNEVSGLAVICVNEKGNNSSCSYLVQTLLVMSVLLQIMKTYIRK